MRKKIRRAIISVSDKTNVLDFARELRSFGVEVLSSGGSARFLRQGGVETTEISHYTGFPEIMDGRVKTLHPKVHGGLLGRPESDVEIMNELGIKRIDLLVVNLYPFESTVADPQCTFEEAIENIDVGGPALLRSGAKNHTVVTVVVDPKDYISVLDEMRANDRAVSDATRLHLAVKAFAHTAHYDGTIANYLTRRDDAQQGAGSVFTNTLSMRFHKLSEMRYGENPHQRAALYAEQTIDEASIANATLIQGKVLSYNNIADADAALMCVQSFSESPACVIVKHANPCGVALGENLCTAYEIAYRTDPTSAFGGIIAFNEILDAELVSRILERQFVEVIIAPGIAPEVKAILAEKPNVRVLTTGNWSNSPKSAFTYQSIAGGLLVQDRDNGQVGDDALKVVTQRKPNDAEWRDLRFAWRVAKYVKSNAIVYCRNQATLGIGAGQMSRVYSARIASIKAADEGLEINGAVMASDAFFPFRDGIDTAAATGITAVIEPGGSMRDEEIIAAADEHRIAMVFTGMRHFRH